MMPLYTSLPLKTLEIRVLDLEPSEAYDAAIKCDLTVLDLKVTQLKPYEALSYTWGAPSKKKITVNGEVIEITENLESFLRHRRQPEEAVTLWIDAICINQDDTSEKNKQIPMMNLIYGLASTITIWLGPASHDSALAMQWLAYLGTESPYAKLPILNRDVLDAFQSLLSRSWWSRVWIIQEVSIGGMGQKISRLTVKCGNESTPWMCLVVAAARMTAYSNDLRQHFPNVSQILELDSFRESSFEFVTEAGNKECIMNMVARYRRFKASDPRDKIYALSGMFALKPSQRKVELEPDYNASVSEVYTKFARYMISNEQTLEILRHCGPRLHEVPSWVPDWSIDYCALPLPVRNTSRYTDVPWWSEPIEVCNREEIGTGSTLEAPKIRYSLRSYPHDKSKANRQKERRLMRLAIGASDQTIVDVIKQIRMHVPFDETSQNEGELVHDLFQQGKIVLPKAGEEEASKRPRISDDAALDAVKQGERITEQRVKRRLVKDLCDMYAPYKTTATTKPYIRYNHLAKTLTVAGLIFDSIEHVHDGFVNDVEADWENATHFMVAVGQCKAIALANPAAARLYQTAEQRLEAFWLTLFVGQICPDQFKGGLSLPIELCYRDWLPEIPDSWLPGPPPVSVTTNGLLEAVQQAIICQNSALKYAKRSAEEGQPLKLGGVECMLSADLCPEDWTEADLKNYTERFNYLASLWHQQPYDLYHRPFGLLNVVPDPYWDTRKQYDKLARRKILQNKPGTIITFSAPAVERCQAESMTQSKMGQTQEDSDSAGVCSIESISDASGTEIDSDPGLERYIEEINTTLHDSLRETIRMVPPDTLGHGMEKYALGRKFFVTKDGRFGMGSAGVRKDDRVAVLFGSDVPFILRKYGLPGKEGWELIGESYIHGCMNGELIEKWKLGLLKTEGIVLS